MLSLPIALLIVAPTALAVTFMAWVFVMFCKASGRRSTSSSPASRRVPETHSSTAGRRAEPRSRVEGPPLASSAAGRVTQTPTLRPNR
jgi:hypothetical protein